LKYARTWSWPLLALALASLGGCTVGPNYQAPKLDVQPRFVEAQPTAAAAQQPDDWWTAFGDPELVRLIQIALAESPDIQSAASRVRQARLGVASARAQLLPQVNAQGNVTNLNFSKNAGISQLASLFGGSSGGSSSGGIAIPGGGITTYAVGFDASWEIDVFGGTRRRIESARATADQAQWSARDATLSLIAEIASQYFQLRVLQQREQVVRTQIANQSRSSQITGETTRVGLVPGGEDQRLRSQLATVQATVEPVLIDERIRIHALAVLLGRDPAAMIDELSVVGPLPDALPIIPPGLPSDLLRRRPDIRAAERKLAAATADIGVATADLYPKFNLTGTAELISSQLANLISINSKQTEASAAVSFPLLDFGRIRTNIRGKREVAEQAWLDYRKTVLVALRDVEDALTRIQGEQRHNQILRSGFQDAGRAYAAADARFRVGLTDQTPALTAQIAVLQAQLAVIDSDGALRTDLVSLDKALGGGWQVLPPIPAKLETERPYVGPRKSGA
jgi:NodT family efflux transporter outer membrane factor (OMF) lipoprotein